MVEQQRTDGIYAAHDTLEPEGFAAAAAGLRDIGESLGRMAAVMDRRRLGCVAVEDRTDMANLRLLADQLLKKRRVRSRFLPVALFDEPAWDMLLSLFLGDGEPGRVCVMQLCGECGAAISSAHRWLNVLEDEGLVTREITSGTASSEQAVLTEAGKEAMVAVLMEFARPG